MNLEAQISPSEARVVKRIVLGRSKKEAADDLCLSQHTISNTLRNVYSKAGIQSYTQLSLWWFCTKYKMLPILSMFFILLSIVNEINPVDQPLRAVRVRVVRTSRVKKNKNLFASMSKLLTIQPVSDELNIPIRTLQDKVYKKKIPYVKIGRAVRFSESEIEKWIGKRSIKTA